MENIMVDLETLGMTPGCVILSIGAVAFDRTGLGREFYKVVNSKSCLDAGLTTDQSTVDWWSRQSDDARKVLIEAGETDTTLGDALAEFGQFVREFGPRTVKVWGNGSDFDNAILACAYKALGRQLPWQFWNNRCFRTLKNLKTGVEPRREGTYHNALDDAKHQARHAIALYQ